MLKLAYPYKDKLNAKFSEIVFQDKYKYYNNSNYWSYTLKLDEDSWNSIEMVSIDSKDNVIGLFRAYISRISNTVSSLAIMNFYDINITYSKDLLQFLKDLFEKYNFRKIAFSVVVGNPIEEMYDKYIAKYGGRIVGTQIQDTKLHDDKYYDVKLYEIFREDYIKHKKR